MENKKLEKLHKEYASQSALDRMSGLVSTSAEQQFRGGLNGIIKSLSVEDFDKNDIKDFIMEQVIQALR